MSQTLAVAARELRERWLLFPAGLFFGFAPLVLPAFGVPREAAPLIGTVAALLLGLAAALVAGASMLARDALDGRLAFLFSRPVPWPAIWAGKWLAAMVLVAGSATLAALPWMLVHGPEMHAGTWPAALLDPEGSTFVLVLLFLGIGLANFNATAFRSRSAWVALDLGLLLLATWLVRRWVAPLFLLQVYGPHPLARPWVLQALLAAPAVALVLASAAQVVHGRTDLRRAHRALSLTFWGVVFVALGMAGLRLAWARAATPADLTQYIMGTHDPAGRWLYAEGQSRRGGGMAFLIDTDRDRYVTLGLRPGYGVSREMAFAADGREAAALLEGAEHAAVLAVDLAGEVPGLRRVVLESSPPVEFGTRLALSASGRHVLLAHERGVSLFALGSGERMATATCPPGWRPATVRFVGEAAARVWMIPEIGPPRSATPGELRILEIAVGREATVTAAELAAPVDPVRAWPFLVRPDVAGGRVLTRDGGVRLRDGATGALVATLLEGTTVVSDLFLADGRIAVAEGVGAETALHVFAADGAPLADLKLDRVASSLTLGPEVAPGRVAVRLGSWPGAVETLVVDLAEGRVVEALRDQQPLWGPWFADTPPHAPGTPAPTRHFLWVEDGTIVRRDFSTGEQRVVAGRGAPPGQRLAGP